MKDKKLFAKLSKNPLVKEMMEGLEQAGKEKSVEKVKDIIRKYRLIYNKETKEFDHVSKEEADKMIRRLPSNRSRGSTASGVSLWGGSMASSLSSFIGG